jgi:enoyl-CoA hydratase/carnithine racemase
MSRLVETAVDGNVGTVVFERPPLNFFDRELLALLAAALRELDATPQVRAVVLRAEGKHFCAGADLRGIDEHELRAVYREGLAMMSSRKPIVAALQGAVVGGGLGLALVADFRIATPETRMSANFAKLGFHQGFGLSVTLPALVGQQRAADLLYTGRDVRGEDALAMGLVDRVVAVEALADAAAEYAAELARSAPLALIAIRATLRRPKIAAVAAALDEEAAAQGRLLGTSDFAEGLASVIEKRVPSFTAE